MSPANKYYELYSDVHVPGRWHIRSPVDARGEWIIPSRFFRGTPVCLEDEPFLALSRPGVALDYTEAMIPVLSPRLVALWEQLGLQEEVQYIPARVEGQSERFFLLNALRIIRCVDEARCEEVAFSEPQEGAPERAGQYRNVRGMKIDPAAVGDAQVFRPWGWPGALIVSGRVKQAMEEEGMSGARFIEV